MNTRPGGRWSRRGALACGLGLASAALNGCGFHLRGAQRYPFARVAVGPEPGGPWTQALRAALHPHVVPWPQPTVGAAAAEPASSPTPRNGMADLLLSVLSEAREKVVVGLGTTGQVREYQLRLKVRLNARTPSGQVLWDDLALSQQRDFGYNETYALAKEVEEAAIFGDLQADLVAQVQRRLAALPLKPVQP